MPVWMPSYYAQISGRNYGIVLAEMIVNLLRLQFWALPCYFLATFSQPNIYAFVSHIFSMLALLTRICGIVLADIIVIILRLQFWALPRSDHSLNWIGNNVYAIFERPRTEILLGHFLRQSLVCKKVFFFRFVLFLYYLP